MNPCKSKSEYLAQVIEPAQRVCKRYGFLPSVLIGQSCLENGFGMAADCYPLIRVNNMVGQKSSLLNASWQGYSVWKGKSITKRTPEQYGNQIVYIHDQFRVFDSIEQSLADFLLFLTYASNTVGGKPKYGGEVMALKDPETLIRAVASRGYATGQTYPTSVMRIINEWSLTQYDDLTTIEPTDQIPPALQKEGNKLIINKNPVRGNNHNTSERTGDIEYICIHYVGALGGAKANVYYYNTAPVKASADFYVGHDGELWQYNTKPKTRYSWAVGGGRQSQYGGTFFGKCTNANSISIEMCVRSKTGKAPANPNDPAWYIIDATYKSTVELTKYLMEKYNIDADHVIRHYDVNGKYCPGVVGWNAPSGSEDAWKAFKAAIGGEVEPTPVEPTTGKVYKVQLGAYTNKKNAMSMLHKAQEAGFNAFITDKCDDGNYRVQVGSYEVLENAEKKLADVKAKNLPGCIKEYDA